MISFTAKSRPFIRKAWDFRENLSKGRLDKRRKWVQLLAGIIFLISVFSSSGCARAPVIGAPVNHAELADGTYEGSYRGGPNQALVRVTIKDHTIIRIEILEHRAWRGKQAEPIVLERIITNQSTRVDAVTGATNSSRVIMNAVQRALEKAYQRK